MRSTPIKAKITSLTADLIKRRAGSALTEEEWKRLVADSVPLMNESASTFRTKMDELIQNPLDRLNSERMLVALPEMPRDSIGDVQKHLNLYATDVPNSQDDFWGRSSGMDITDTEGVYEIPDL